MKKILNIIILENNNSLINSIEPIKNELNVTIVENKKTLFEHLSNNTFDLIILDSETSLTNVLTVLKDIKNDEKWSQTPVFVSHSESNLDQMKQLKVVGFSGILKKPISLKKLQTVFERLPIKKEITEDKIYDLSYLRMFSGGDKEFEAGIIKYYLENSNIVTTELQNEFDNKDFKKIVKIAHTFANQSYFFGYKSLYKNIQILEKEATSEKTKNVKRLILEITKQNNQLLTQLSKI